ncbi:MAG TPA: AMP-binding protein [Terriglobales bacterium]|nr:AMP-binding protein [Terriglobales bacterium]
MSPANMPAFYDSFLQSAGRFPDNVALEIQRRDRVESCTYAELRRMAESVGRWIHESGFAAGSRLAILADNHPRWVAVYLGIIAAGCTAVPLDTAFNSEQVAKLLKDSGSSLLFVDSKHFEIAQKAASELNIPLVLTDASMHGKEAGGQRGSIANLDDIFAAGSAAFQPAASRSDDLAALLYTSGTTADPKGVMLTHANLMAEAAGVFGVLKLSQHDSVLGVLPLFHSLAQMANLLLPLAAGARVVYLETLNTTELLRALRERQITAFAVVPQFFYLIHERIFKEVQGRGALVARVVRLLMRCNVMLRKVGINAGGIFFRKLHETFGSSMRYLVTGGSRFEPQIARDFHALGVDVLQAYGLTETSGGAFVTPPGDIRIGSVGKPLPSVEGKILDPQTREDGAPATGEIAIRGPIVMKGYWNRPDATAAVLQDGWLLTGDLGYFDSHGNLFITGRKKEVIVLSNGKNIYPEEIEAYYLKTPVIKEICVIAIESRPGDATSERLHGVVVPNFAVLRQRKIVNARELIRFDIEGLSAKLPSTKRLGSFEIWQEDLPRTTTRKLKRFEIERRVREKQGSSGATEAAFERPLSMEDEAWLEQPEVQNALQIIRDHARSQRQAIRPADNLELDLGLDSMQRVELLAALEEKLGGEVDESRLAEIYTVHDLIEAVRQSAGQAGRTGSNRPQSAGWRAILREQPDDPDVLDLARARPFSEAFFYLATRLVQVFALDRFHLKVQGLEKLPLTGAYIICSNHQSYLDPIIMDSVLPWPIFRNMFAVGTSDIFGSPLMRRLARILRVVVVDPDANLMPAMRAGAYGLRLGRILILYPEGERSIDGTPRVFKKGAAILSIHLQVPIIPVAIDGFYEAWPRAQSFQGFTPLKIAFGDPIHPPAECEASEAVYEKLTAEVKGCVVKMWKELRGKAGGKSAFAQAAN